MILRNFRLQSKLKNFNYGNFSVKIAHKSVFCAQFGLVYCFFAHNMESSIVFLCTIWTCFYTVQVSAVRIIMSRREVNPFFSFTSFTWAATSLSYDGPSTSRITPKASGSPCPSIRAS